MTIQEDDQKAGELPGLESAPARYPVRTFQDMQDVRGKLDEYFKVGHQAEIRGDIQTAIENYNESLRILDQVLAVECDQLLDWTDAEVDQAKEIQKRMTVMREDVSGRLELLQTEASHSRNHKNAHSSLSSVSHGKRSIDILADEIKHYRMTAHAITLFAIPSGVWLFRISADGTVKTTYELYPLNIVKFDPECKKPASEAAGLSAFLQIDDWLYPLMPGLSPALITEYGAHIFPDVLSEEEGSAVAVVIPLSVSENQRKEFVSILDSYTVLDNQLQLEVFTGLSLDHQEGSGIASMISLAIDLVAGITSWAITFGASVLVWLLHKGFENIRAHISPATKPCKVHPKVQQGIVYLKCASSAPLHLTGYVVGKLGEGTLALALKLALVVKEEGSKITPSVLKHDSNAFVKGAAEIASSTVRGMATVCVSLDNASLSLMKSMIEESVQIIQYKYGEEVGALAHDTLNTAHNMVSAARVTRNLDLKTVALRAGSSKGRKVLYDHIGSTHPKHTNPPEEFVVANAKVHQRLSSFSRILMNIPSARPSLKKWRTSIEGVIKTRSRTLAPYPVQHFVNPLERGRSLVMSNMRISNRRTSRDITPSPRLDHMLSQSVTTERGFSRHGSSAKSISDMGRISTFRSGKQLPPEQSEKCKNVTTHGSSGQELRTDGSFHKAGTDQDDSKGKADKIDSVVGTVRGKDNLSSSNTEKQQNVSKVPKGISQVKNRWHSDTTEIHNQVPEKQEDVKDDESEDQVREEEDKAGEN